MRRAIAAAHPANQDRAPDAGQKMVHVVHRTGVTHPHRPRLRARETFRRRPPADRKGKSLHLEAPSLSTSKSILHWASHRTTHSQIQPASMLARHP